MNASTNHRPSLEEVQQALANLTGYPPTTFVPQFKLLDCANEIEQLETLFGVAIKVGNYINATVDEVMQGMSPKNEVAAT